MILKIKRWFNRNIKVIFLRKADLIERFRKENYELKGQLIKKRHIIVAWELKILELTNDLNLLGSELDIVKEKKKKAEKRIAEHVKISKEITARRDEFLSRVKAPPDVSITSFNDYKYWISEPFIIADYKVYEPAKGDIDGMSAIRGLGKVFDNIDEKKDEKKDEVKNN